MICENCGDATSKVHGQKHYHCQGCGHFQFPSDLESAEDSLQPSGRKTEFQCPKCELPLEVGRLRNAVDVCFCSNCRGFVIDSQTLGPLIQHLRTKYQGTDDQPKPLDPVELDRRTNCPACWEPMDAHPYYGPGNSVIDTCLHCQLVWFDHGELAKIVRAPGVRGDSPASGNQESQVLRRAFDEQCHAHGAAGLAALFMQM